MTGLPAPPLAWAQLAESLRLPVLATTRKGLARLAGRPSLRGERVAALAAADPGLGLEILRAANAGIAGRSSSPALADGVETVAHALTLLGVENAVALALDLPALDLRASGAGTGLVETLATAHVAGELAVTWALRGGRRAPEAHRAAAHAYLLADLVAWHGARDPAAAFSELERADPGETASAERGALGASRPEIGAAIARAWQLPELARSVFEIDPSGAERGAMTALAARLALATRASWIGTDAAALLEILASRLGVEPEQALAMARTGTAAAARRFPDPRMVPAARHLPLTASERVDPEWLYTPPAAPVRAAATPAPATRPGVPAPDPAPIARPVRRDRLARCREAIRSYAEGRLAVHETMHEMVCGMRSGLSLDRVILAMLSQDRTALVGRFSSEDTDDEFLQQFRIDLTEEHLFTRLMRKRQALDVNQDNRRSVWAKLPSSARTLLSERGFYAMSLFVNERPVGLFYADWHTASGPRPDTTYEQFKKLCIHTGKALERPAA